MAIVTEWTDPHGGPACAVSFMTMNAPNNTTENTNAYPQPLPHTYITLYAEATGPLNGTVSIDLQGTYDGSSYVTLVSNIIAGTSLATPTSGTFNLEQYSALSFRFELTTNMAETEDITIYLIFEREV